MMYGDRITVEEGTATEVVEETKKEAVAISEVDINRAIMEAEGATEASSMAKARFYKIKNQNSRLIRKEAKICEIQKSK